MTPAYLLPPLADQYAAFLRGVAAAPDDDTPRLVLADWLEEHDAPERAEFIRVQCELARIATPGDFYPGCSCKKPGCRICTDINPLRQRERELWDQGVGKQGVWRHFPTCGRFTGPHLDDMRRGFIGTVRGPLGSLLGEPGALERMGPELLAVRRAEVSDKQPELFEDCVIWNREMRDIDPNWEHLEDERSTLPGDLFDAMEGEGYAYFFMLGKHGCNRYPTEAAARDALSQAVLALARRRAGLGA